MKIFVTVGDIIGLVMIALIVLSVVGIFAYYIAADLIAKLHKLIARARKAGDE